MKKSYLLIMSIAIISTFIGYKFINTNIIEYTDKNYYNLEANIKNDLEIIDTDNDINNDKKNVIKTYNSDFSKTDKLINDNRGIPVLYYHSVHPDSTNEVIITPELLKEHLSYLKDENYISLTMNDVRNYLVHNEPIPEKSILITFDDGYMDNYYNAFPILKDLNLKATIFCTTSALDGKYYLSEDAIREMSDYGIDIQSHTVYHPNLDKLTYADQLIEMINSKKTLERIINKEIYAIAYPFGDFNDDTIKAAKEAGYTLGFTTNRGLSDREDNLLKLDRIYVSSNYDLNTFKAVLNETKK